MEEYWSINHIVNILMNLIFSAAFFLNRSQTEKSHPLKTPLLILPVPRRPVKIITQNPDLPNGTIASLNL